MLPTLPLLSEIFRTVLTTLKYTYKNLLNMITSVLQSLEKCKIDTGEVRRGEKMGPGLKGLTYVSWKVRKVRRSRVRSNYHRPCFSSVSPFLPFIGTDRHKNFFLSL